MNPHANFGVVCWRCGDAERENENHRLYITTEMITVRNTHGFKLTTTIMKATGDLDRLKSILMLLLPRNWSCCDKAVGLRLANLGGILMKLFDTWSQINRNDLYAHVYLLKLPRTSSVNPIYTIKPHPQNTNTDTANETDELSTYLRDTTTQQLPRLITNFFLGIELGT